MKNLTNDFMQALLALNRIASQNMLTDQLQQMEHIKFVEDVVVVALERIGEEWQKGNVVDGAPFRFDNCGARQISSQKNITLYEKK